MGALFSPLSLVFDEVCLVSLDEDKWVLNKHNNKEIGAMYKHLSVIYKQLRLLLFYAVAY